MSTCPNCGNAITCGCQERTASNGTRVCASCINSYEQQIIIANQNAMINNNINEELPST